MNKQMTQIEQLTELVLKFRHERDWEQFHNPKDLAISLVLESSEVLEHFQWKTSEEINDHIKQHKEDIGDEIADVLSWILLIAHDLDIDLKKAYVSKLEKNNAKYPVALAKGNHKKYTEHIS